MKLKKQITYSKKEAYRDATLFIIICEGQKTEPAYFSYFDRLTSRLKVLPLFNEGGKSAPKHLVGLATTAYQRYANSGPISIWIVIDVDRWKAQIPKLQKDCKEKNWKLSISNPCFEVWLNAHSEKPTLPNNIANCKDWKPHVARAFAGGGFNPQKDPIFLARAISRSRKEYQAEGYLPKEGCTQLYVLGEELYQHCKSFFEE